jgi:hypothetical protein
MTVSVGAASAAFALLLANIYVLVDALRDDEFRPVFLTYLHNTLKLVLNTVLAIHNGLVATLNLAPRLGNLVLPGNPFGTIPQSDYFQFDYGEPGGNSAPEPRPRARAQSFMESGAGGVTVNFNGVVTDPVAVGLEIRKLLGSADRRSGAM